MKTKGIVGSVVVVAIVIVGAAYFMNAQPAKASTIDATSSDSNTLTTTQNTSSNLNNNNNNNNNNKNVQTQNTSKINSKQSNNSNNNQNNNSINNSQVQSKNNVSVSDNNQSNSNDSSSNTMNTNAISNKNSSIEWVLGKNELSVPSTIVVKNTTGEKISNQQLIGYIRKWILNAQLNYSQGCVATMWAAEFFNAVPDSDLIQAFINANGEAALSENITANEFGKTNAEIAKIISKNQPLLTQSQIFEYIYKNILAKNEVVKIVNKKDSYVIYGMSNGKEVAYDSISKYTGITACC